MKTKKKTERRTSSTVGCDKICCPYFIAHGEREIVCEGMIEGTKGSTIFRAGRDKAMHEQIYCEDHWGKCEIALSVKHWRWEDE